MRSICLVFSMVLFVWYVKETDSAIDDLMYEAEEERKGNEGRGSSNHWQDYRVEGSQEVFVKYQFDMLLREDQYNGLIGYDSMLPSRLKRNAIKNQDRLWPNGTIPYHIDNQFNATEHLNIRDAIDMWSISTCLNFIPFNDDNSNRLKFVLKEDGCGESFVGMAQGTNYIYLSKKCSANVNVIAHEIGHAIGLFHEQMRHDRDEYVTINNNNIKEDGEARKNFDRLPKNKYQDFSKPYDLLSIMHYGKLFFSKNKTAELVTISPKNESYLDIIGEVQTISYYDAKIVCQLYNCSALCKTTCNRNESFVGKNCQCMCRGSSNNTIGHCKVGESCGIPDIDYSTYDLLDKDSYKDITEKGPFNDGTIFKVEWKDRDACGNEHTLFKCKNGAWQGELPECRQECVLEIKWTKQYNIIYEGCYYNGTIPSCDMIEDTVQMTTSSMKVSTDGNKPRTTTASVVEVSQANIRPTAAMQSGGEFGNADYKDDIQDHLYDAKNDLEDKDDGDVLDVVNMMPTPAAMKSTDEPQYDDHLPYTAEHKDIITLSCKTELTKTVTIQCNNGSWTTFTLDCPKHTGCTYMDDNTTLYRLYLNDERIKDGEIFKHNETFEYRCKYTSDTYDYDYLEEGMTKMTCKNGVWQKSNNKTCPDAPKNCPPVQNGHVRGSHILDYNVTCDQGYVLVPSNELMYECTKEGTWKLEPFCKPVNCSLDSSGEMEGKVRDKNRRILPGWDIVPHADDVRFSCPRGMYPDLVKITCMLGKWNTESGKLPTCIKVDCQIPFIYNGTVHPNKGKYVYNDRVRVNCNEHFELKGGNPTSKCSRHGNWTGLGYCKPICYEGDYWRKYSNKRINIKPIKVIKRKYLTELDNDRCKKYCTDYNKGTIICKSISWGYEAASRKFKCSLYSDNPIKTPNILQDESYWNVEVRICEQ